MDPMSEEYSREAIARRIQTKNIGRTVHFYECTDSTNARARLLGEHGVLVVADRQTAGKGRRGRSWESPAGKNLYFTLALKPDFAPDKASMLTLVMAVAVLRGIEMWSGKDGQQNGLIAPYNIGIKWPNDLVINGKKICGILTEMSLQNGRIDQILIGVGINVKKQDFALELSEKATDLETQWGQEVSRAELLSAIMKAFEEAYETFLDTEDLSMLQEFYNARLVNLRREVRVLDPKGEFEGKAEGINESGELLVRLADGRLTAVYAGEVSVRGVYGYV